MTDHFRNWLVSQGYSTGTIATHASQRNKVEGAYGPLESLMDPATYNQVFAELSYSAEDERRNKANPSRLQIGGNLRNNLASYKATLALYRKFHEDGSGNAAMVAGSEFINTALATESPEKQRLSFEKDMQAALRRNIQSLEAGLTIIDDGMERAVHSGLIDILGRDANGAFVVIELKAGKTDSRVIGQTLGYMGDVADEESTSQVRGIIVANDFDQRTISAARAVPNLSLVRYAVSFSFHPQT
jgi:endonuclease